MKPELQRRVQRYGWDKASNIYDLYWQQQLKPAQDLLLDMANLQPSEHVLDIACGTGLVTFPAAEAVGSRGKVIGLDISDSMVDLARRTAKEYEINNVSFERMEAERLELPEQSFDVALCALGLMYIPDPKQTLREMYRVLNPGGRIIVAVWGDRRNCGWSDVFPIVDHRVNSEVCPLFFQLGTGDALASALHEVGFSNINQERISHKLHYQDAKDACEAIFNAGPVAMAYHRFDEQTRKEACAEYLASIKTYQNGNEIDIPGEFVVAKGEVDEGL